MTPLSTGLDDIPSCVSTAFTDGGGGDCGTTISARQRLARELLGTVRHQESHRAGLFETVQQLRARVEALKVRVAHAAVGYRELCKQIESRVERAQALQEMALVRKAWELGEPDADVDSLNKLHKVHCEESSAMRHAIEREGRARDESAAARITSACEELARARAELARAEVAACPEQLEAEATIFAAVDAQVDEEVQATTGLVKEAYAAAAAAAAAAATAAADREEALRRENEMQAADLAQLRMVLAGGAMGRLAIAHASSSAS